MLKSGTTDSGCTSRSSPFSLASVGIISPILEKIEVPIGAMALPTTPARDLGGVVSLPLLARPRFSANHRKRARGTVSGALQSCDGISDAQISLH